MKTSAKVRSGRFFVRSLFFCLLVSGYFLFGTTNQSFGTQDKDESQLQQILNKMDEVSKIFRSYTADFSQKKYTAILREFNTPETGKFYYAYGPDRSILMRHEITDPGTTITTIKGDTFTRYQPRIKKATKAHLGKYKNALEYLYLGMGQSPSKLKEQFNIAYKGTELFNGADCAILVFKPKDPKAAASIASITVWIKKESGVSVQYKLQEPNGDYLLVSFFNDKLNPKISNSKFEQNLPKDTDILRH